MPRHSIPLGSFSPRLSVLSFCTSLLLCTFVVIWFVSFPSYALFLRKIMEPPSCQRVPSLSVSVCTHGGWAARENLSKTMNVMASKVIRLETDTLFFAFSMRHFVNTGLKESHMQFVNVFLDGWRDRQQS